MKILMIFLLALVDCSGQSLEQASNVCKTDDFGKLNVQKLDSLLLGNWEYQYSFVGDTCFYIANLGDLSVRYSFEKMDIEEIKSKYPKLYSFGNNKLLFGLICSHDKNPFGETTYPLVDGVAKDSSMVHVTHYIEGNGVGKGYSYFLESINSDTLVLFNERYYDLEEIKITGVRHVYIKQKEQ